MSRILKKIKESIRRYTYLISIKKYPVKVLSLEDTVSRIIDEKLSVSRIGDGEFRWMMMDDPGDTFEKNSKSLSENLIDVIKSRDSKLLVCLPDVYDGLDKYKPEVKVFWNREISKELKKYYHYLDRNYDYGNSFFSRPYISYKNQDSSNIFRLIKNIWNERDILIVEGSKTRFGIGNDLLSSANNINRILVPAVNAYSELESIYEAIEEYVKEKEDSKELLVLLAIGPTATILAKRITELNNIQAIDIGHLDIEYEWFLRGSLDKELIPGKYVNESKSSKFVDLEIKDETYINQIWKDISK
ncbi:GT-D fold domain-containing glycosyltransferase [Latilactobacillus curvatus]|uniref:GT-D fold domain-containing glycosyltransferase n=1 Tax=Latilactobacillus curvatus TaxID=28038 RepID=UPI0011DDD51E|nr:GT-D fold domain-containing glycosyltransferase [Latilactobacillus curvatus]